MEVVVTTGAVGRAKLQSNHRHQQTNAQFLTGRMPFLSPNQQCQSTEGNSLIVTCVGVRHNMPPPLQVDDIFVFIRQVAPVPACWNMGKLNQGLTSTCSSMLAI